MGDILEIGFFFWLGAAAATTVIMGVFAAACMIRNGQLPEQDIPYWQGLLIYLPTEVIPAAVFSLTAAISSATGIFPLISATGSGLVSLVTAGAIQVVVMAITLSRYDDNQQQKENWRLSKLEQQPDLLRQVEIFSRHRESQGGKRKQQLLVQEQRPGFIFRLATSIPVLVFFVLPIVLYCGLQLLSVLA